jgi:hypothetical protein
MNAEELAAFKVRLASDPELQSLLAVSEITRELVVESGLSHERALLQSFEKSAKSGNLKRYSFIGTSVVITALVSLFVFKSNTETSKPSDSTPEKVAIVEKSSDLTSATLQHTKTGKSKNNHSTRTTPLVQEETYSEAYIPKDEEPEATNQIPITNELPNQSEQVTSEKEEIKSVSCESQFQNLKFFTLPSCENKPTGAIQIRGMKSSWKLMVNDEAMESTSQMGPGKYTVKIKTDSGCEQVYPVEVKAKSCFENKQVNWSFNDPDNWTIETSQSNGTITIMDRNGAILLQDEITSHSYFANPDKFANTGLYQYKITYSNGESTQGFIQIVR